MRGLEVIYVRAARANAARLFRAASIEFGRGQQIDRRYALKNAVVLRAMGTDVCRI